MGAVGAELTGPVVGPPAGLGLEYPPQHKFAAGSPQGDLDRHNPASGRDPRIKCCKPLQLSPAILDPVVPDDWNTQHERKNRINTPQACATTSGQATGQGEYSHVMGVNAKHQGWKKKGLRAGEVLS